MDRNKRLALNYRIKGMTYSDIGKILGVSKSTAHEWVKSQDLTEEENRTLKAIDNRSYSIRLQKMIDSRKLNLQKKRITLHNQAVDIVRDISLESSTSKLLCSIFIWCEGEKSDSQGVRFINSDPVMVKTFLDLLRRSFIIDESRFRVMLHLHSHHSQNDMLEYWSELTDIPKGQFHKPHIKKSSELRSKPGYSGCVSIRYHDADLGKLLKMIYSEFSEQLKDVTSPLEKRSMGIIDCRLEQ